MRHAALDATATLLARLSDAGARHHDLNVKNVLLAGDRETPGALVLDVDRITFGERASDALRRNLDRLERSARKCRDQLGAAVSEEDLAWLRQAASARLRGGRPTAR